VLILEDEPLIRRLIVSNLVAAGCEVTQTADGADTVEAYSKARAENKPFDLLIMDLSIPGGVSGLDAMQRLRQIDPDVKAIVSSGYSDDPVMQRYLDYGFRARLPKPYQPAELRKLVDVLLGE
jgi:CheY-like chemotaxis protein